MAGSMRSGAGQACLDKETRAVGEVCETPAQTGVFLTAIGWLPYAVTLFSFALSVAGTVITGELGRLALINIYNLSSYVWTGGLVLSLGYAVYRVFYKKDYDEDGDADVPKILQQFDKECKRPDIF